MIDFNAFAEEYQSIQKEAAIGQFLSTGAKTLKGIGRKAAAGWKGTSRGAAKGQSGFQGAWTAGTEPIKHMAKTTRGSKALAGAATVAGGGALGAYGAYRGGKAVLGGGQQQRRY